MNSLYSLCTEVCTSMSEQPVQNNVQSEAISMQLLDVYLHRASPEQVDNFLKTQCFHLLANQLHQHESTAELAEVCLTIVFGRPFCLTARSVTFLLTFLSPGGGGGGGHQCIDSVPSLRQIPVNGSVFCVQRTQCIYG